MPFLPSLSLSEQTDKAHKALIGALARIGPLLVTSSELKNVPDNCEYFVLAEPATVDVDKVIQWLDNGALKVVVTSNLLSKAIQCGIPSTRLMLLVDDGASAVLPDKLRSAVSGLVIKSLTVDIDLVSSLKSFIPGADVYVLPQKIPNTLQLLRDVKRIGATLVIPSEKLTLSETSDAATNIADAFLATISSDRQDGLFPTIVTSYANSRNLGLVYSSPQSVKESILTGKGVYQSRKHGLWRKGDTSGATQQVVSIRTDCDEDALEFTVIQAEPGFCHLNRQSCFGDLAGLAKLERTLISRLEDAPPKSYTRRLFNDSDLLQRKIREEADELCAAEKREDVAFEAADLLYFMMVKCIKNGVSLADVEASLDKKARKITRRAGDAKPQYSSVPPPTSLTNGASKSITNGVNGSVINGINGVKATNGIHGHQSVASDDRIRMRTININGISKQERASLLQRPVVKSDDMISRVKPLVDRVRKEGDSALRELTLQFDKASISDVLLLPPFFDPKSNQCLDGSTKISIDEDVRKAIDAAYRNIQKFHQAQVSSPLVVETIPGVTCRRFAKAISRVGLYIPGGTAILPSTALMLGIPAQVAGCTEIVLATPSRPDGTISPEVLYVASLVGATGILKSGGAQAIAALAYGTETVPKVDKIFGPGNQWVMAAKMLVSTDSDAMVAIDMPAGPSEVLVSVHPSV
jgi:phosphoribosyl-ATP pyrophosphohydrolase/phosphoribosyl-AMP cyclohydrolase/histidinol dehydrogenase